MNDEKADTPLQKNPCQDQGEALEIAQGEGAERKSGLDLDESGEREDPHVPCEDPCVSCKEHAEDQELFESPVQDPDPASALACESDPQAGLEQLRGELTRLYKELSEKEAFWTRVGEECDEFRTLYPEVSMRSLPDSVWEDVKKGIPLSAAYALAEKRRAYTEAMAAQSNSENKKRSSGAIVGTENEYFSPGEVRAMSSDEVHANYHKIMRSMQSWR